MKNYLSILIRIAPSLIKGRERIQLPKTIGHYRFVRNLSTGYPFATGVYLAPSGKRVVIKLWTGIHKDIHYYALLHEIAVMKTLTRIQQRLTHQSVYIPNFIACSMNTKSVYLISQYIRGTTIAHLDNSKKQWAIHVRCVKFLNLLANECTQAEKEQITVKSAYDFLFLYPFLLMASILRHPEFTLKLIRGIPIFLSGIPQLLRMKPTSLVHGDLHPRNILVSGNRYYILDLEQVRFCYPEYESVIALSLKGNSADFKKIVWKNLFVKIAKDGGKLKAIATLIINNATHYLTDNHVEDSVLSYINAFDKGIELSKI